MSESVCSGDTLECNFTVDDLSFERISDIQHFDRNILLEILEIESWECSRRVWDKATGQRCVWHANVEEKCPSELAETVNEGDLHGAKVPSSTSFQGFIFPNEVRLIDSDFSGVNFGNKTDLSGADIRHANFSGVSLVGADLSDADIYHVDFSEAELFEAVLSDANIGNTDLSRANLADTKLTDASVNQSNLTSTDLSDSILIRTEFKESELCNANLSDSDMTNVNLKGSDLRCAGIDHDNFEQIQINGATKFGGKSLFESITDSNVLRKSIFRTVGRTRTSGDLLKSAERQYRATQRKLRTNNYQELLELDIREKHARRKRALAEQEYSSWIKLALYRWPLGYGERLLNVILTSILIIIGFGLVYPFAGGVETSQQEYEVFLFGEVPVLFGNLSGWAETLWVNLYFSIISFSTLGYGDIQPANSLVQGLAGIQSIIGALLIAYLVFILGRRSAR